MSGHRMEEVVPAPGEERKEGSEEGKTKTLPLQEGDVVMEENLNCEERMETAAPNVTKEIREPGEGGADVGRQRKPKVIVEGNSTVTEGRRLRPRTREVRYEFGSEDSFSDSESLGEQTSDDDGDSGSLEEANYEDDGDSQRLEASTSGEDDDSESEPTVAASGSKNMQQKKKKYVCDKCGFRVLKPALLRQHMRSHSNQKPFVCPESGCGCAYKRQDHLNRHMKQHQGVVFFCPETGCGERFTLHSNLQRHLKKPHKEKGRKPVLTYACAWPDCGKAFRYPSFLRTHEKNVHEKLHCVELYCIYPGCGDKFPSEKALVTHSETCHPYLLCEKCGETIPRESFWRHARIHATKEPSEIVCPYDDCGNTYTRETNLRQHMRSVHLELKPFTCSYEGCNKRFAHKAALERHESSAFHSQPKIDFQEEDELCLSKPRGGRRPKTCDETVDKYMKAIIGR